MISTVNIYMLKKNKTKLKMYLLYISFIISKNLNMASLVVLHCDNLAKMEVCFL